MLCKYFFNIFEQVLYASWIGRIKLLFYEKNYYFYWYCIGIEYH